MRVTRVSDPAHYPHRSRSAHSPSDSHRVAFARGWLGLWLGSSVGCWRFLTLYWAAAPDRQAKWRLQSASGVSRLVLAMQKVDGSSPFIRSSETRWKRRVSCFQGGVGGSAPSSATARLVLAASRHDDPLSGRRNVPWRHGSSAKPAGRNCRHGQYLVSLPDAAGFEAAIDFMTERS